MPEATRKQLQEEISSLEGSKSDMDSSKKVAYLNNIFRLPWDSRVDTFWDVQYSRDTLEDSHYGMNETKERILEFIAKNKRMNSNNLYIYIESKSGRPASSIHIRLCIWEREAEYDLRGDWWGGSFVLVR